MRGFNIYKSSLELNNPFSEKNNFVNFVIAGFFVVRFFFSELYYCIQLISLRLFHRAEPGIADTDEAGPASAGRPRSTDTDHTGAETTNTEA